MKYAFWQLACRGSKVPRNLKLHDKHTFKNSPRTLYLCQSAAKSYQRFLAGFMGLSQKPITNIWSASSSYERIPNYIGLNVADT